MYIQCMHDNYVLLEIYTSMVKNDHNKRVFFFFFVLRRELKNVSDTFLNVFFIINKQNLKIKKN